MRYISRHFTYLLSKVMSYTVTGDDILSPIAFSVLVFFCPSDLCVLDGYYVLVCWCFRYDEGDGYGRPPMPPPPEMWGYRPPFDVPFDPRWGRGMPPPFMPPPPDFRLPVNLHRILNEVNILIYVFSR